MSEATGGVLISAKHLSPGRNARMKKYFTELKISKAHYGAMEREEEGGSIDL